MPSISDKIKTFFREKTPESLQHVGETVGSYFSNASSHVSNTATAGMNSATATGGLLYAVTWPVRKLFAGVAKVAESGVFAGSSVARNPVVQWGATIAIAIGAVIGIKKMFSALRSETNSEAALEEQKSIAANLNERQKAMELNRAEQSMAGSPDMYGRMGRWADGASQTRQGGYAKALDDQPATVGGRPR